MHSSLVVLGGRSAWKGMFLDLQHEAYLMRVVGPFFVSFPNLKQAIENNIAVRTDARACTILPNFVGYATAFRLSNIALNAPMLIAPLFQRAV